MGRLDSMLLWGHSLTEYEQMFALTAEDKQRAILDYGAGPACFNAQMYEQGYHVVSCDAIYDQSKEDLTQQFDKEFQQMIDKVNATPDRFVWDVIEDVNELEQLRRQATTTFLQDYEQGLAQGRYLAFAYPQQAIFQADQFSLAVASHAGFIENSDKPAEFLVDLFCHLSEVAQEIRIFPLLDDGGNISPLVGPVLLGLQQQGLGTEVREVDYQFQRGGNAMLRVWKGQCDL